MHIYLQQLNILSLAFFLFIPFATQLLSTPITSSKLRNQAALFTELRLLQAPHKWAYCSAVAYWLPHLKQIIVIITKPHEDY